MSHVIFAKLDFESILKSPRKGQRRQIQIAEATIEVLFSKGLVEFSFEQVAQKCEIARGVIYSYFPTLTDLLLFSSGLIRYQYQTFVIGKVAQEKTYQAMLRAYAEAALSWVDVSPKHANVWILFFHHCSISKSVAEFNQKLVDMGTSRIEGLILAGIKTQEFNLRAEDAVRTARHIQLLITGGLISRATEKRDSDFWSDEKKMLIDQIIKLVQN